MHVLRNFVINGQGKPTLPELKDLTGKFSGTSVTHSTEKSTVQTSATSFYLHLNSLQHTRPLHFSSHARLMHLSAQQLQAALPARHHLCPLRPNLHLSCRSLVSALHMQNRSRRYLWTPLPRCNSGTPSLRPSRPISVNSTWAFLLWRRQCWFRWKGTIPASP